MTIIHESEHTKVTHRENHYEIIGSKIPEEFAWIDFQHGPIEEAGVNGCQIEDLLAICIHRLEGFQSGEFPCDKNSMALNHLGEALDWLNQRTEDRKNRGVEGANKK